MKFNEKLIELRKQKGLSQEELGYQLNVTRQTVSKWELGQTTPEMDKLVEMSKIFNVTVDELTNGKEAVDNEVEKIEDKHISEGNKNNSTVKVIILVIAIFIIGAIIVYGLIFRGIFNFGKKATEDILNNSKGKINEMFNGFTETVNEQEKKMKDDYEQNAKKAKEDAEKKYFTNVLEMYNGTKMGNSVKYVIDKIVTNNKKNEDSIVTVVYNGKNITEPTELQDLKSNFKDTINYEVSFEYDENNYIYQMNIK